MYSGDMFAGAVINERANNSMWWKLTACAATALLGGCFGWEAARYYTQQYTLPQPLAVQVAPRMNHFVTYAAPLENALDEETISEKAVEEAVDAEKKPNPRDFFLGQKSWYPKKAEISSELKTWYIIDATNLRLGRMSTEIANLLRGASNPHYHPAADTGDFVIVINAEKVMVTGNKARDKLYRRHVTGRPGSLKVETFQDLQKRLPERIVEKAVKGMLPKTSLGRQQFTHLKVYKGPQHPHAAQKPVEVKFEGKLSRAAEPQGKR